MTDKPATAPGPLMLDIAGCSLDAADRELLAHPVVGGLIFFTRNFENPEQLQCLVDEVRAVRPELLLAVDQEGGRVQRFREGFVRLPPMRRLGERFDRDPAPALAAAGRCGWLMAAELRACGIDFSFAPVLDLDYGQSTVIGDRAFHSDPEIATALAGAFVAGMRRAGMAATGKHFPGHGYVVADSHVDIPVDDRPLEALLARDLLPFERLIVDGLEAVMPAHVIYEKVDHHPAGFSPRWLREILRREMGFDGVIFSDDLAMEGASVAGSFADRARAALYAGCDMVLVCNDRDGAVEVLEYLAGETSADCSRLPRMAGKGRASRDELCGSPEWREALAITEQLAAEG